jgi:leucyl-tRNA synthetase
LRRKLHQTLKKVTEDMEGAFHFNTAIASVMELVNEASRFLEEIQDGTRSPQKGPGPALDSARLLREVLETLVILLGPFVPHLAEELWEKLGHSPSLFSVPWPSYDPKILQTEKVSLVVQVNGKIRSKIEVETDLPEDKIKEIILKDAAIQKWVNGKAVKQWVIIPKKLVNLVV